MILSPTLEVTASDDNPTDTTLDINCYGRQAGSSASDDFTIIVIPDTQMHAQNAPNVMYSRFQWIANQKETRNIAFATSVVILFNTATSTAQWTVADTAYDYLDAGGVSLQRWDPVTTISAAYTAPIIWIFTLFRQELYQGYYTGGENNYNNYSFFSASGNDLS